MKLSEDFWPWVGIVSAIGALSAICLGAFVGWVLNLVHIVQWAEPAGLLVLRIICIFLWPIGCVLGWIV